MSKLGGVTFRTPRPRVVLALCALLLVPLAPAATRAQEAPDGREQRSIAEAVERLGSADPAEREAASQYLWAAGSAAEAALREAAAGDDVEAARRAGELLRHLRYGIRPDTPKDILHLLAQFRQSAAAGDRASATTAVNGLAARGPAGLRVLTRLWQDETDEAQRRTLGGALAERARPAAATLLADGDGASAVGLLEAAGDARTPWGEQAVRDLAALLLLQGDAAALDERVARLKPLVADASTETAARARSARLLAYLCRARGDLAAARWAAEQAGEPALLELVLAESGAWKELAQRAAARLSARPPAEDTVEELGFAAAYHRLAGDADGLERYAQRILAVAARRADEAPLAAEALFLNDRPDAGMEVLLRHKAYAEAAELLSPRMKFDELLALARTVRAANEPDAPAVEARAAAARHVLGDTEGARTALEQLISAKPAGGATVGYYVLLASVATSIDQPKLAEEAAARGLALARPTDDASELLEEAGFGEGERAARWWAMLRDKYREPARVTFGRLRSVLRGELPPAQMEQLARSAADHVRRGRAAGADPGLADVGDTLLAAGHREAATNYFRWLSQRPPPPPVAFIRLGDLEADAQRWDTAAAAYGRAWELDRTQALPLLLRGAAIKRAGREKEGAAVVELAHLLPLADEAARHALMGELDRRQLRDDARRQRDVIVRTAAFQSWHQSDALRRAGDEAHEKQDYLAAADLWDRAFLDNQSRATRFAKLWANFAMPALIHRSRALGLMRAGDLAAAKSEADLAMRYSPSDADALIAFVNELDRLGKRAEADELYRRHAAPYRALCEAHPDSAQAHNQLAWAAAKCRRELDDALAHALRAVELDPASTACLDTLAETHFQRGEVQNAIEIMNRCVEMEPKEKRHQEQLARFNKALTGTSR